MALSYGLTNPATGMISTSTPEPTPIGYKIYKIRDNTTIWESDDFGLTWTPCAGSPSGLSSSLKYDLVYDPVNNKVICLGGWQRYNDSTSVYSCYATPALNTSTTFTRGTARPKSTYVQTSTADKDAQYGTLYDYNTDSLVSLHQITSYSGSYLYDFDYLINSGYTTPNTYATVSYLQRRQASSNRLNINIVTGDNGIILEIAVGSDSKYKANLFRFIKNSATSYTKQIVSSISASTLNNISDSYRLRAAYLKNVGFVIKYGTGSNLYTRVIYFDGTLSSIMTWPTLANAYVYSALSSNNYYSDKVYLAMGNDVYYTTDGINWNTCSGVLTNKAEGSSSNGIILNAGNNIMVGCGSYAEVSTDGGQTFTKSTQSVNYFTTPEGMYAGNRYTAILVPFYS